MTNQIRNVTHCQTCRKELRWERGRKPIYCSPACKQAGYRLRKEQEARKVDHILAQLATLSVRELDQVIDRAYAILNGRY